MLRGTSPIGVPVLSSEAGNPNGVVALPEKAAALTSSGVGSLAAGGTTGIIAVCGLCARGFLALVGLM